MATASDLVRRLQPADTAAVILDVDGTLAPIVARPELASVSDEVRSVLGSLVARYALVGIVSGRPSDEAARLVGVDGIRYAGHYGVSDARPVSGEVIDEVDALAATHPGTWVERKGVSLSVHVRQANDPDEAERRLLPSLVRIARDRGLDLVRGKRTMELVPRGPRKGGAVERLAARAASVLYAGDDLPDLEAFESLDRMSARGIVSVKVAVHGDETPPELEAAADLVVEGPAGLLDLLRLL